MKKFSLVLTMLVSTIVYFSGASVAQAATQRVVRDFGAPNFDCGGLPLENLSVEPSDIVRTGWSEFGRSTSNIRLCKRFVDLIYTPGTTPATFIDDVSAAPYVSSCSSLGEGWLDYAFVTPPTDGLTPGCKHTTTIYYTPGTSNYFGITHVGMWDSGDGGDAACRGGFNNLLPTDSSSVTWGWHGGSDVIFCKSGNIFPLGTPPTQTTTVTSCPSGTTGTYPNCQCNEGTTGTTGPNPSCTPTVACTAPSGTFTASSAGTYSTGSYSLPPGQYTGSDPDHVTTTNPTGGWSFTFSSSNPYPSVDLGVGTYTGTNVGNNDANGATITANSPTACSWTITVNPASATPPTSTGGTTGTVHVRATLNGTPISDPFAINFVIVDTFGTRFEQTNFSTNGNADYAGTGAGSYTVGYTSGAPAGATLRNIAPSASQTLNAGSEITFTYNFVNAPTATLTASPSTIDRGESSTLTWNSSNVTSCAAAGGFSTGGAISNSTGVPVSPLVTSSYQISCNRGIGSSVNSNPATVTIRIPTACVMATIGSVATQDCVPANTMPTRVLNGSQATVSWNATNVNTCTITRNGEVPVWGSLTASAPRTFIGSFVDTLTTQTTYEISCTNNAGGTAVAAGASQLVNVVSSYTEF